MVQSFYKGAKSDKVAQFSQAAAAPDISQTLDSNARRTQALMGSIDALNKLATGTLTAVDKKLTTDAKVEGEAQAARGEESTASPFAWGGFAQQQAYNTVRGELVVRDMPSSIDRIMKSDPENKRPLDEMTSDERAVSYSRARQQYFKEKGIDNTTYQPQAEAAANNIQSKQLSAMDVQAQTLGQAKAMSSVADTVAADARSYGGDPVGLENHLTANFDKYAVSLGGTQQAQEAIAKGLLSSVTTANPSLEALTYLKSPEAKKRFSSYEGFDQVVKQADVFTTQAQAAYQDKLKKTEESGFYVNLMNGAWTTKEDVTNYFKEVKHLTPKEQFELTNKATRYMKVREETDLISGPIARKEYNIVNAAKPEVIAEAFGRHVGTENTLNLAAMTDVQAQSLTNWIKDGYVVPEWVSNIGNSKNISNGNPAILDKQLTIYNSLVDSVGKSTVGAIFDSATSAKMELYARLKNDVTLSPAERANTLNNFDSNSKVDPITGMSRDAAIAREFSDKGDDISGDILSFVKEGGTNLFSGRDDLQPWNVTSDISSAPALDYASREVAGNYSVYRHANIPQDEALDRAKADFQKKNQWVTWENGATTHSYVPSSFGSNFPQKATEYLTKIHAYKAIANDHFMSEEEAKQRVTVQPSMDYNSSRKLSVYFDGIEQDISFNVTEFNKQSQVIQQDKLNKTISTYQKRIASPEFKAQQNQLTTVQKLMKDLGMTSARGDFFK